MCKLIKSVQNAVLDVHVRTPSVFLHSLTDESMTFCCRPFQALMMRLHCFSSSTLFKRHMRPFERNLRKIYQLRRNLWIFVLCVLQGKIVALNRYGGEDKNTARWPVVCVISRPYSRNDSNRTFRVQDMVEDVVTYFYWDTMYID